MVMVKVSQYHFLYYMLLLMPQIGLENVSDKIILPGENIIRPGENYPPRRELSSQRKQPTKMIGAGSGYFASEEDDYYR